MELKQIQMNLSQNFAHILWRCIDKQPYRSAAKLFADGADLAGMLDAMTEATPPPPPAMLPLTGVLSGGDAAAGDLADPRLGLDEHGHGHLGGPAGAQREVAHRVGYRQPAQFAKASASYQQTCWTGSWGTTSLSRPR